MKTLTKPHKDKAPIKTILTSQGLMRCTVEDFDPQKYKGLKQNCGRPSKHATNTKE